MSLVMLSVTTVTCDGTPNSPCPDSAIAAFDRPQSVALRLAAKQGWKVGYEHLCPSCHAATDRSQDPAPHTVPMPLIAVSA